MPDAIYVYRCDHSIFYLAVAAINQEEAWQKLQAYLDTNPTKRRLGPYTLWRVFSGLVPDIYLFKPEN